MARLIRHLPAAAATAWIILAKWTDYGSAHAQMAALLLTGAALYSVRRLAAEGEASPIHKGMAFFFGSRIRSRLDRFRQRLARTAACRRPLCRAVSSRCLAAASRTGSVHLLFRP